MIILVQMKYTFTFPPFLCFIVSCFHLTCSQLMVKGWTSCVVVSRRVVVSMLNHLYFSPPPLNTVIYLQHFGSSQVCFRSGYSDDETEEPSRL